MAADSDLRARAIIVHGLAHVRAALAAGAERGCAVTLMSAPNAASYAGVGWFAALLREAAAEFRAATYTAILDCGDRADLVQAALREGLKDIAFRGPHRIAARLVDIAGQRHARLHRRLPPALDLLDHPEPLAACRAWLSCHSEDTGAGPTGG